MTDLRRNRLLVSLAAVALTVAGLVIAPSATAESGSAPSKVDKAATGAHHCTVDLTAGTTKCFDTFREPIEHATGGRVTDGDLSPRTATVDSETAAKLNSAGPGVKAVVIGVRYYWENFNRNPDGSTRFPDYTLTTVERRTTEWNDGQLEEQHSVVRGPLHAHLVGHGYRAGPDGVHRLVMTR